MRIKNRWQKNAKPKSLDEIASSTAFICWKLARNGVENLINEKFLLHEKDKLFNVIFEYIAFLVQITDRLMFEKMQQNERQIFITVLVMYLAGHMQENKEDKFGKGDYKRPFIDDINQRFEDYSEFGFEEGEPGFNFLRYFGEKISHLLGEKDEKWVISQMVEIEAPEALEGLTKSLDNLFAKGYIKEDCRDTI
jgi:hypothetical protein